MRREWILARTVMLICCSAPTLYGDPAPPLPVSPPDQPNLKELGDPLITESTDPAAGVTPQETAQAQKEVQSVLFHIVERWNAHDLDGYLSGFWKSPDLLAVSNRSCVRGWTQKKDRYEDGYRDRKMMGTLQLDSFHFQLVESNVATTITRWKIHFGGELNSRIVYGTGTETWLRLPEGWKIVMDSDSYNESNPLSE